LRTVFLEDFLLGGLYFFPRLFLLKSDTLYLCMCVVGLFS
jgi:hypothetical protein